MGDWKSLKIEGIVCIEKLVAEFNITELKKTPWRGFKVKIFQRQDGWFEGRTNLKIKDEDGCGFGGVGDGKTIEDALKNTIQDLLLMIDEKEVWNDEDFEEADPYVF